MEENKEETTKKLHSPLWRSCAGKKDTIIKNSNIHSIAFNGHPATDCFKSVGNERRGKLTVENLDKIAF